jgi:hypothetical protein
MVRTPRIRTGRKNFFCRVLLAGAGSSVFFMIFEDFL